MSNESVNYWKLATIGILLVGATVAATLLVVGRDSGTESAAPLAQAGATPIYGDTLAPGTEKKIADQNQGVVATQASPEPLPRPRATQSNRNTTVAVPPPPPYAPPAGYPQPARSPYPSQAVMDECNRYASAQVNNKTEEVLKNAALGAAIGAAVGAAGGAIAGGGKGAGKGAAIGGVTGAAGGTLYGLNEAKSHDAQYQAAYSSCMRAKGY